MTLGSHSSVIAAVYYLFFLLLIVSGLWIFEEVVISDLGFLNVSEALKPSF